MAAAPIDIKSRAPIVNSTGMFEGTSTEEPWKGVPVGLLLYVNWVELYISGYINLCNSGFTHSCMNSAGY